MVLLLPEVVSGLADLVGDVAADDFAEVLVVREAVDDLEGELVGVVFDAVVAGSEVGVEVLLGDGDGDGVVELGGSLVAGGGVGGSLEGVVASAGGGSVAAAACQQKPDHFDSFISRSSKTMPGIRRFLLRTGRGGKRLLAHNAVAKFVTSATTSAGQACSAQSRMANWKSGLPHKQGVPPSSQPIFAGALTSELTQVCCGTGVRYQQEIQTN